MEVDPTRGFTPVYRWPFRRTERKADPATKRDIKVLNWFFALVCVALLGACFWWLVARASTGAALEETIQTPGSPFASISTPDGKFLFVSVSTRSNSGVLVYSRSTAGVKETNFIQTNDGAFGLALSADSQSLLVADRDGVAIVDVTKAEAGTQQTPLQVEDGFNAVTTQVIASHNGEYIFASDERKASVSVIRLVRGNDGRISGVRLGAVPVDSTPVGLAISPDDRFLYVTSEVASRSPSAAGTDDSRLSRSNCVQAANGPVMPNGTLTTIDVTKALSDAAGAVISRVASGCSPVRVALTSDGEAAWVTVRGDDRVFEFNTQRLQSDPEHAFIGSVDVGSAPVGLALLDQGKFLVVADSSRFSDTTAPSSIQVIALMQSPTVISTVPAGRFPREFSISPDGKTLFLTNFDSDDLMVFNIQELVSTP